MRLLSRIPRNPSDTVQEHTLEQEERIRLKELYASLPDQQLLEMGAAPQSQYQQGAYELIVAELKRRALDEELARELAERAQAAADSAAPVPAFVRVYSTPKPAEVAMIKSLLDSQEIPYSIQGEYFNSLYGTADGLSSVDVLVRQDYCEEARELLKDIIQPPR